MLRGFLITAEIYLLAVVLMAYPGLFLSALICVVSSVTLILLVGSIWAGKLKIERLCFQDSRMYLAIFAVVYAIYSAWRLIANVKPGEPLPSAFVPELIALSIFWILVPPVWFFVEYFAVESNCIRGFEGTDANGQETANLKTIKNYADYASKIWAGVLALLLALIALKK